jgi:aryl-alcohol dehydrogenase-like predicted oxidoreductase
MKYRKLGRTGLLVSEICLGTMTFGEQVNEADAITIIKSAIADGVNFIDTANGYVDGKSEEIVGKALREDRNAVVLATKVGAWKSGPGVNDTGLNRKHIMKEVEDSLRRLGTDYIDLYYVHKPDYNTPIEETLRALDDLVHQGKVRNIACSNFRAFQLCDALWVSDVNRLARFECIQSPYNLITRDLEYELLPLCAQKNVGITVYNPLAGGLLTGKHDMTKTPTEGRFTAKRLGKMYTDRYWDENNFQAVASLKQIAEKYGHKPTHLALAWLLHNETVTSIICGVTSLAQLKDNIGAVGIELGTDIIEACDQVWSQFRPPRFLYGR